MAAKFGSSLPLTAFFLLSNLSISAFGDEFKDLKDQVHAIQRENQTLREQLEKQSAVNQEQAKMIQDLAGEIEALKTKDESISGRILEFGTVPAAESFLAEEEASSVPSLKFNGFARVKYTVQDEVNAPEANANTFALGQFDLFVSSQLSEKLSALGEIVFESDTNNETEIHLERSILKYSLSDLWNIELGRMHIPLGYWPSAYHHGAWLYTTVDRPIIYEWDDEGGILPMHIVGVQLTGKKDFEDYHFQYDVGIVNGRGETATKVANIQDRNDAKAFIAAATVQPDAIAGLELGGALYADKIPADTTVAARNGEIDELILGGHAVYLHEKVELLAEGIYMLHDDEVSGSAYHTHGFYLQGVYQWNKWKPYYRFDYLNFGEGDPYYPGSAIDTRKHAVGIRWDPFTWNAIKFEYAYQEREREDDIHAITMSSDYTF